MCGGVPLRAIPDVDSRTCGASLSLKLTRKTSRWPNVGWCQVDFFPKFSVDMADDFVWWDVFFGRNLFGWFLPGCFCVEIYGCLSGDCMHIGWQIGLKRWFVARWWLRICLEFSPLFGEDFPIWRAYFSNELKPPTIDRLLLITVISAEDLLEVSWKPQELYNGTTKKMKALNGWGMERFQQWSKRSKSLKQVKPAYKDLQATRRVYQFLVNLNDS